jgi:recombinational DNA repair protein RecT
VNHRPRGSEPENENQLLYAYALARLRGGGVQFEVMDKAEIDRHRARSRARNNGPWVTDYVPMALKTTIRKIAKYLPKASMEMARAMELDEKADLGADQMFDVDGLVIDQAPKSAPTPQAALEGVKEKLRTEQGKPAPEKVPAELTADDIQFGGGGR